jgi:hypothetical protein
MRMRSDYIIDPMLGELVWDAELLVWLGHSTMAEGTPFRFMLHSLGYETQLPPFEDATWDRTISQASREALGRVRQSDSHIRSAVAEQCLPMFANWNDDEFIDAPTFQRRLLLESVILLPSGRAEILFGDDGMFAGHSLIAHLDPDGVVRYVEMFG